MKCQECRIYLSVEEINNGWQLCSKCRMSLLESLNIEYQRRDKLISNDLKRERDVHLFVHSLLEKERGKLKAALKLLEVYRKQNQRLVEHREDCECTVCQGEIEYEKTTNKRQDKPAVSPTTEGT